MILSLIWLTACVYLYGYAFTGKHEVRSGLFGFAPLVVITVLMSTLSIPLYWLFILGIGIAGAMMRHFNLFGVNADKNEEAKNFELKLTPDGIGFFAALFTIALLFHGANQYPYLEDDDPWIHALGINQVAHTFSAHRPIESDSVNFERWYLEPYPPAFDILLGILRQLNDSTLFTLKFFNALLVAIAVLAFYFWIKDIFPNSKWLAAIAAILISVIPGFMSHFIWAQTLAMLLVFIAFMAFAKLKQDSLFMLHTLVCVSAVLVTQPTVALIFGIISGIFFIIQFIFCVFFITPFAWKNIEFSKNIFIALAGGLLLSCIIFWVPAFLKFGEAQFFFGLGFSSSFFQGGTIDDTSGGVIYGIWDFLFPPSSSKIDQAVGIGFGLILLIFIALWHIIKDTLAKKIDALWIFFVIFLLIGFLGIEGNALPIKLFPHRFWVFFAIPVAVISAYTIEKTIADNSPRKVFLLAIIGLIIFSTSLSPRIAVQTTTWPPGTMWLSEEELSGYISLLTLPPNTKIFPICGQDSKIIGFDKLSEPWNSEYKQFKKTAFNHSSDEISTFLKPRGYKYVIFDVSCVKLASSEIVQKKLNEYISSKNYEFINQNNSAFFLFRIK